MPTPMPLTQRVQGSAGGACTAVKQRLYSHTIRALHMLSVLHPLVRSPDPPSARAHDSSASGAQFLDVHKNKN